MAGRAGERLPSGGAAGGDQRLSGRYARVGGVMMGEAVLDQQVGAPTVSRGLLLRYRALALGTAVLLVILVFVGVPLQFAAGRPAVMNDVGTVHGFLYLGYLFVAFQLTRRLNIPKWQMLLVLLAGTVPFCGFVAERKMTKRFEAVVGAPPIRRRKAFAGLQEPVGAGSASAGGRAGVGQELPSHGGRSVRSRWLSRRALLLHLEVAIVAPGCLAAGWWQVGSALNGNGLSWVYAVEWPVFASLAVAGWWYLVHEDPDVYRARKAEPSRILDHSSGPSHDGTQVTVDPAASRLATLLAWFVAGESALGMVLLAFPTSSVVSLAHGVIGLPLASGSILLLAWVRGSSRVAKISGWTGAVGTLLAGGGGLLAAGHLQGVVGMLLMLVGAVVAGFGYLVPTLERMS
ncbi:MAG: DUF3817 domain-containing protein [Actinomycetota bacterium]|nr:DUF3817 domain-containing protein [Actinomycetota bacterium]